jgi:hypothetical protein
VATESLKQLGTLLDSMPGSHLRFLNYKIQIGGIEAMNNIVGLMTNHYTNFFEPQISHSVKDIAEHRPPSHSMKHFAIVGLHTRPFAGGKDYCAISFHIL